MFAMTVEKFWRIYFSFGEMFYKHRRIFQVIAVLFLMLFSLRAEAGALGDLKKKFASVLGLIMVIAFIVGCVLILIGAVALSTGNHAQAKWCLIAGSLAAGAPLIMTVYYAIMGIEDAAVKMEDAEF